MTDLQDKLTELADELDVPGVAAGVWCDGQETYAFTGVTSVDNPLPVDAGTLFQFGSTGKTFTATAIMRLVEGDRVDLDAPVRRYVPELRLAGEDVAARVTVLQLLNHTAGWDGDFFADTGTGDDSLARYVDRMVELNQLTPPGATVSYNNASLSLAGRLIENVTGQTYEQALRELLLDPLGLRDTWFFPADVMTRRFVVGHTRHEDGRITVNRPWALPRSATPAGGISATAADQIAWARFHLGEGTAPDGTPILSRALLQQMRQPTADMTGSALGDAVGISWLLRDVDGVRLVSHGGTTNGQYSDFTMVPERGFAVTCLANCGPNGSQLNHKLTTWALEHYLDVRDVTPEPLVVGDDVLAVYAGRYETISAVCTVTVDNGRLLATVAPKPAMARVLHDTDDDEPEEHTTPLALLPGERDPFVVPEGPAEGMRGYFTRDAVGHVAGIHFGGRLAARVDALAG